MCKHQVWYRQIKHCHLPWSRQFGPQNQFGPQRLWNSSQIDRIPETVEKASSSIDVRWGIFQEMLFTGWNSYTYLKSYRQEWMLFFLLSFFRWYLGVKLSFKHNSVRENCFLNAYRCSFLIMRQKSSALQKIQRNALSLASYWIKRKKTWMIKAALKFKILLIPKQVEKGGFAWVTPSEKNYTPLCRGQGKNVRKGKCSIWSSDFFNATSMFWIYVIKPIE